MHTDSLVEIKNLNFFRGQRQIFRDMSFNIPRGKITAIMGPSGSGKTTLLRLMGGQLRPHSGTVTVLGEDVTSLKTDDLYRLRQRMGMLFQNGALLTDLSVFENVAFPLREHTDLTEELLHDLVLMKLQAVGLRGAKDLMPDELSGGMARRVALARAIVLDPTMVMYDEPFTGQDPIAMGVLVQLISRLNKALDMTSIIVTHDVKEAALIADHMILISEGQVVAQGSPDELAVENSKWVKQFLQGLADGPVPFHYPAVEFKQEIFTPDV